MVALLVLAWCVALKLSVDATRARAVALGIFVGICFCLASVIESGSSAILWRQSVAFLIVATISTLSFSRTDGIISGVFVVVVGTIAMFAAIPVALG